MGTGGEQDGFDPNSRRSYVQKQEGDALLGPASVAGAHQAEHLVGVVGMGGPDLGAVEHIVLAVRFGPELQRSQVRAGTGLRVALAPVVLPGQDARKQLRLLRLGAVADQHGPHMPRPIGASWAPRRCWLPRPKCSGASGPIPCRRIVEASLEPPNLADAGFDASECCARSPERCLDTAAAPLSALRSARHPERPAPPRGRLHVRR